MKLGLSRGRSVPTQASLRDALDLLDGRLPDFERLVFRPLSIAVMTLVVSATDAAPVPAILLDAPTCETLPR